MQVTLATGLYIVVSSKMVNVMRILIETKGQVHKIYLETW